MQWNIISRGIAERIQRVEGMYGLAVFIFLHLRQLNLRSINLTARPNEYHCQDIKMSSLKNVQNVSIIGFFYFLINLHSWVINH